MKYQNLKEPVFITSVNLVNSKHGGEVYEIKMMGIKTQKNYYTYADPKNNNWSAWRWIVEVGATKGVVLNNLKLKDADKGLINADSTARPEYIVSKEELADLLEEFWKSRDTFNKLFGDF